MEIETTKSLLGSLGAPESLMGILLLAGALLLFRSALFGQSLEHIPLLGEELSKSERIQAFKKSEKDLLAQGYKKFRSIFRYDTPDGPLVVVPPHLMDEIKGKSEEDLDNIAALSELTQFKHTNVNSTSPMMNHLVKGDLTAALNRINPRLAETAKEAVASEMASCPEWAKVPFFENLLRVVAIVSGDIFLGRELCRNEEYMSLSIGYTVDAFTGIFKLKMWRPWLRPVGFYFVPEMKIIQQYRIRVKKFLTPVIKERRGLMEKGGELPDDLLQWTLKKTSKFPEEMKSDDDVAMMQLRLSLAAIHTTSTTGGVLMRDMCSHPGLIKELREEIETVLAKHNGVFSTKALYDMKLLDSVMKESQRMHMLGPAMFHTQTRRGIHLSDGTYLPPRTLLTSATLAASMDPTNFPNPETFDPYRFLKMRRRSDEEAGKHQFVTLTKDMISFGYGRHACPGRFFAANEIKIIFIEILRRFDVETREGEVNFMGEKEIFFRNVRV